MIRFSIRIVSSLFALLLLTGVVPLRADEGVSPFGGKHVLVVGIDGTRSDCLTAANAPNLDRLIANGAVSYDGFAGGEPTGPKNQITVSGPGWASVLTGVWDDKHKIADNKFAENDLANYPHFFVRLAQKVPSASLASIVDWAPIHEHILDGATFSHTAKNDQEGVDEAIRLLRASDPDVLFLYFGDVDHTGHASGFSPTNPEYVKAIEKVDAQLGSVLETIEKRPKFAEENWLVIVTTDHGGYQKSHGGQRPIERRIFFIVSGKDAARGEFSPGPGHVAVPPTVFRFLGIDVDPAWGWESEPFGLKKE